MFYSNLRGYKKVKNTQYFRRGGGWSHRSGYIENGSSRNSFVSWVFILFARNYNTSWTSFYHLLASEVSMRRGGGRLLVLEKVNLFIKIYHESSKLFSRKFANNQSLHVCNISKTYQIRYSNLVSCSNKRNLGQCRTCFKNIYFTLIQEQLGY